MKLPQSTILAEDEVGALIALRVVSALVSVGIAVALGSAFAP